MSKIHSAPLEELSDRLVTLTDGRLGLRSGLQVQVTEPPSCPFTSSDGERSREKKPARSGDASVSLSPLHGERVGERGHDCSERRPGSPRPSDGRGVRGEGPPESQPILDFIASAETLDRA